MKYDNNFLLKLDQQQEREMYVKLIALDLNDNPIEAIEGKVSTGSINVDGLSAVRRTCSLTLIAPLENTLITDAYWCFNTKIKIEIGLGNLIDSNYPPIIWFEQGVFIITSFSINRSINNITINLQAKDKMCCVNGEVAGSIYAQTDFGQIEVVDYEEEITTLVKLPIKEIIRNALREFCGERDENIIINDLDEYGYELWSYMGLEPMYYLKRVDNNSIEYVIMDQDIYVYTETNLKVKISELADSGFQYYSTNTLEPQYNTQATIVSLDLDDSDKYYVIKIEPDATAGYHRTELVYNTDLILNAGETIVALLDKLKNMLGNFEYFYDIYGRFVFQKKNDYIQELWSTSTGALTTPILYNEIYSYQFLNKKQFTAFNPSPNIDNVKNDFSVWGGRESLSGETIPIHARCAIDKKPIGYISPWERYERIGALYEDSMKDYVSGYYFRIKNEDADNYEYIQDIIKEGITKQEDYPALSIYLSKLFTNEANIKLFNYNTFVDTSTEEDEIYWELDNYHYLTTSLNKDNELVYIEIEKDKSSITYTSLGDAVKQAIIPFLAEQGYYLYGLLPQGREYRAAADAYDWRELIYQMAIDYRAHNEEPDYLLQLERYNPKFIKGKTGYEQYYVDMEGFWRQLYAPNPSEEYLSTYDYYGVNDRKSFWNTAIHTDPTTLNFWFDFIDSAGEINQYSVSKIGNRPKVVNDSAITSIYYRETPEVQFIFAGQEESDKQANTAYTEIQLTENDQLLFYVATQGNSAIAKINELIQTHTAIAQGLNITCIPIFYLQPNTRIYIKDEGDFTVEKISYNLNHNGTMTISGNKIFKQFI